jgi:hypothetical protein
MHRLALGTGQTLNLVMAGVGAALLVRSRLRRLGRLKTTARMPVPVTTRDDQPPHWAQQAAFVGLLACCLTIPSNWTQNIPVRYGRRHPGLKHSWLYPAIEWAPPPSTPAAAPSVQRTR